MTALDFDARVRALVERKAATAIAPSAVRRCNWLHVESPEPFCSLPSGTGPFRIAIPENLIN